MNVLTDINESDHAFKRAMISFIHQFPALLSYRGYRTEVFNPLNLRPSSASIYGGSQQVSYSDEATFVGSYLYTGIHSEVFQYRQVGHVLDRLPESGEMYCFCSPALPIPEYKAKLKTYVDERLVEFFVGQARAVVNGTDAPIIWRLDIKHYLQGELDDNFIVES